MYTTTTMIDILFCFQKFSRTCEFGVGCARAQWKEGWSTEGFQLFGDAELGFDVFIFKKRNQKFEFRFLQTNGLRGTINRIELFREND